MLTDTDVVLCQLEQVLFTCDLTCAVFVTFEEAGLKLLQCLKLRLGLAKVATDSFFVVQRFH